MKTLSSISSIAVPNDKPLPGAARSKALRAARAVSMTVAIAGGGCYMSYEPAPEPEPPVEPPPIPNASAQPVNRCASLSNWDNWSDFYAACCSSPDAWQTTPGCKAWGPFVPPAMPGDEVA